MKNFRFDRKNLFLRKGYGHWLFLLLFLTFCIGIYSQTTQYVYKIPEKLNDGWEVASLKAVGINTKQIESITKQILTEERFENIRSMLIVKNGKLVHEAYSIYHQRNTLHVMASITKTITSTLIGIAIDKGFIKSVDTKVLDLLPQYAKHIKDPGIKNVTVKHLMTMSSGLEWFEHGYSYNDPRNSEHLMVDSQEWMRFILSRPIKDKPGTRFLYNTGGIHLLSAVIKSATGLYAHQFAEKYLLHPMGIRAYMWNRDPEGFPCTGGTDGGLGLRTRDIAKFGWLYFKDGTWKGKSIISRNWIKEATRKHKLNPHSRRYYGYNWFPGSMAVKGRTFNYVASFGYGGQTLYIVPEFDLILVFTCELTDGNANVHIAVNKTFQAVIQN